MTDYTNEAQAVADAMNAVYENKQTNKKNNISGDFSSDNVSYPTVKAAKAEFGTKVTTFSETPSDANYPSEKLMKTELDKKADVNDLATVATSGSYNDLSNKPTVMTPASHTHGNLSNDGKVGTASGKIITTGTNGAIQASDSITKSQISDFPSTMTPASHTHGDITNDGKVGSTANKPLITGTNGKITAGSFGSSANTFCEGNDSRLSDARTPTAHTQATSTITNATAYDNIKSGESTTVTLTDLSQILSAINDKLGALGNFSAYEVTSDKGTASASKMGKLYIVSENSKVNVYYVKETSGSYSWQKMDVDILDELNISWNDITDKPSTFTPASHTHGNITNDGKVGSTANKPLITTTGGTVIAGSFGTSSGTFAEGNHTHNYATSNDVQSDINDFAAALAEAINPSA